MAHGKHLLKNHQLKTLGVGKHSDGGNLIFVVDEGGARRWMVRYQLERRRREMGLGGYPEIGLAEARAAAHAANEMLARRVDPLEYRKAQAAAAKAARAALESFGAFADRWYAEKVEPELQNDKHKYQWRQTLGEAYMLKEITLQTFDRFIIDNKSYPR